MDSLDVPESLRELLERYHSDFKSDGAGQDVSSKGVRAYALTADQVASNLATIRLRLTQVIRDCDDPDAAGRGMD